MPSKPESKDDVIECATKLTEVMAGETYEDTFFTEHLDGKGMMIPPAMVKLLEVSQGEAVQRFGYTSGADTLHALQFAAKEWPNDESVIGAITRLAETEEKLLDKLMRRLAKANNIELPDAQSFGHAGGPQGQGGMPPGMPMMDPKAMRLQMQLMKMATESLDKDKQEFVQGMQQRMMAVQMGQSPPPNEEERKKMMEIQQELMQYMAVMGPILQQQMEDEEAEEKKKGGDSGSSPAAGADPTSPEQKKSE